MLDRRVFLGSLLATAAAARPTEVPSRTAKVERLFKSPDGHPNALEASSEGLWVADQITDRAHLMSWDGKLIKTVETESSNTSGMAYGGGFLWMAANGKAMRRTPRPTDASRGEVLKVDPATGKTIARYPLPDGGGVHGLEYTREGLWVTFLKSRKLALVDPKDFHVIRQIPMQFDRAHGLGRDRDGIWVVFTSDRVIQKLDVKDGRVLEQISIAKEDPEPHGMCLHNGHLYYCDAGLELGGKGPDGKWAGWICRIA